MSRRRAAVGSGQSAVGSGRPDAASTVRRPSSAVDLPLLLVCAALVLAVVGGGMIYDRVDPKPGYTSVWDLVGVPFGAILGAAAMALAAWKGEAKGRVWGGWVFAALLAWCAVSAVFAQNRFAALSMLAVAVGAFATGTAVRRVAVSREAAMTVAVTVAAAASFVGAVGVREYIERWRAGNALWRVFGGFINPDFLAGYLLVALPVTAALFLQAREPVRRLLGAVALLVQLACLILTGSRLGLLALAVEGIFFGILVLRTGALARIDRRAGVAAAVIVLALVAVVGRPLIRRLLGTGTEAHSGEFRVLTWKGTMRMAEAHPLFGTGIGTFETSYPPYQVVGYTQHAHNGFLQFAGEAGAPALALLAVGLAGAVLVGCVWIRKREDGELPAVPDLVVAGCVSGIVGSAVHNLFDSDFYVPATLFTVAAAVGLVMAAVGREVRDEGDGRDERDSRERAVRWMAVAASVLAVWLVWAEGRVATARIAANGGAAAFQELQADAATSSEGSIRELQQTAIDGYKTAHSILPDDPEYALKLATLYGNTREAEQLYRETAESSRLGKAYYRYGRYLSRNGRGPEAFAMHRKAREQDPNNLQNLLELAHVAKAVGKPEVAERVYQEMIRLDRSDFGRVRALPELVDWEFGMAYCGLAELQLARGDKVGAAENLKTGTGILGESWRTRHLEIAALRITVEVRREASDRYEWGLKQLAILMDEAGRKQEADEARARIDTYHADVEADKTRKE